MIIILNSIAPMLVVPVEHCRKLNSATQVYKATTISSL